MWQLETLFFASSYIWLTYIFEAMYNTVVTSHVLYVKNYEGNKHVLEK